MHDLSALPPAAVSVWQPDSVLQASWYLHMRVRSMPLQPWSDVIVAGLPDTITTIFLSPYIQGLGWRAYLYRDQGSVQHNSTVLCFCGGNCCTCVIFPTSVMSLGQRLLQHFGACNCLQAQLCVHHPDPLQVQLPGRQHTMPGWHCRCFQVGSAGPHLPWTPVVVLPVEEPGMAFKCDG